MKTKALALSACVAFLCSCSTLPKWSADYSTRPPLPADAPFNKGAGDDIPLFVMLNSENGEKLLFMVDTGMPFTVLDKSLESKLGKRLGTSEANYSWFGKTTVGVYGAPKLYLGDIQLLINDRVLTDDVSKMSLSGQQIMGILGMDCLRHYCIQLDFDARKIRFLDSDNLKTNDLGKSLPITISGGGAFTPANFLGLTNVWLQIDTGCTIDAALKPKFVQQKLLEQKAEVTHETKTAASVPVRVAYFEKIVINGNVYRHFILSDCVEDNLLGLRFMGRYLTTLNFPKQTIYLKPNAMEY